MKTLTAIVESEALNARAMRDVEEAMVRAELAARLADNGGSYRPAAELANTVPMETAFAAEGSPSAGILPHVKKLSPYPKFQIVLGEEELQGGPVSSYVAKRTEELEAKLRTGEINAEEHAKETGLFPVHVAAERILQTYENYRHESFGEKLINALTNLASVPNEQSYQRAFLPKALYGSAAGFLEKIVRPYNRPAKISASYAPNGDLSTYAYSKPGKGEIGLPYEYGFMSMRLIRELGLYDHPEALDIYMASPELMHLRNPRMTEEEIRTAVYNSAASMAQEKGEMAEMYGAVAKAASAFAYGHRGVGPMSVGPLEQKLRRVVRVIRSGRPYTDAHGDGLYTGDPETDEPGMSHNSLNRDKGKGDLSPEATMAYRAETGHELSQLESESGYEHIAEQHEAAAPESETPASALNIAAEYEAAHNEYGSPEPATNDYSAQHEAAEAAA